MSRKTKQQKIIADLRRQLQTTQIKPVVENKVITNNDLNVDYSYVKHDLLKTLTLTVLAIGVQVVLWYVIGRK